MKKDMEILRHSLAHVMAAAVQELFPGAKFGIGPVIEHGFYYDFDLKDSLKPEDLPKIEKKMRELISKEMAFEKRELNIGEAIKLFKKSKQDYKVELLEDIKNRGTTKMKGDEFEDVSGGKPNIVSIYQTGAFVDLCRGPHVKSARELSGVAFKLEKIAGAYWRGNEKNPMLQRVYGLAFALPGELDDYLKFVEEAGKRDHRKLGRELDLFNTYEEAGAGLIYWHPKGGIMRSVIEDFWKQEHFKNGYEIIYTPHIGKSWLWETSGHLDFYKENMYSSMDIDGVDYYLKPMNCPFHILMYKSQKHSYRDLPLRWAELGTVYRYEDSGVLYGLLRVRGFTQDDAHIICSPDCIKEEILRTLRFSLHILRSFGFRDFKAYLSTKPEKSIGQKKNWDEATKSLEEALKLEKLEYEVDKGGGAFYGPKIDLKIKDALGREWQCTTIQFDFNLPERFDMTYVGEDGKEHRPYMVHRALLGSLERFFGVLIEHYAGAFPLWISPVQVSIITVGESHLEFSEKLAREFKEEGIRVEVDKSDETVGKKIRKAEKQKIPYMLVIGDKEMSSPKLHVRIRGEKEVVEMSREEFLERIKGEIRERK